MELEGKNSPKLGIIDAAQDSLPKAHNWPNKPNFTARDLILQLSNKSCTLISLLVYIFHNLVFLFD